MTKDEVIQRLSKCNRAQVARDTGLKYMWLARLEWGKMKDPGSSKFDALRSYLISRDIHNGRPQ